MGFVGTFMNALSTGFGAFREQMLNADPQGLGARPYWDEYGRWQSRRLRYGLHWALYQQVPYSDLIQPSVAPYIKSTKGLYQHTRALLNPCYRLGEFWAERLMPGTLDWKAGDGEGDQSSLPIKTDTEALRPAIARLWKDSHWQTKKDLYCRFGAVLGDVALFVRDDPVAGKVKLEVCHPGSIAWIQRDPRDDSITGYVREEYRHDPRAAGVGDPRFAGAARADTSGSSVIYREECYLTGSSVVYRTFLNGEPFDWSGNGEAWEVDIPFVPLVMAKHEDFGQPWGMACFHSGFSRSVEVDDQASGLSDQIRKAIRAPYLLAGVQAPKPAIATRTPSQAIWAGNAGLPLAGTAGRRLRGRLQRPDRPRRDGLPVRAQGRDGPEPRLPARHPRSRRPHQVPRGRHREELPRAADRRLDRRRLGPGRQGGEEAGDVEGAGPAAQL